MVVGGLVLCAASVRPWFVARISTTELTATVSRTAWRGSPLWVAGIIAALAAVPVWFGAVPRLGQRGARRLSAVLLLAAVALIAQEHVHVDHPPIRLAIITATDGRGHVLPGYPDPRPEAILRRHYVEEIRPPQRVALFTVLAMFGLAAVRPAGGRRRSGASPSHS